MKWQFTFIVLIFIAVGCDDKLQWIKTSAPDVIVPVVDAIAPDSGTVGTVVIVTGSNFSATLSDNTITINGTLALLTEASASTLKFIAPEETTGPVVVTVKFHSAENKPVFTYE